MKIYVVMGRTGEYSDNVQWAVKAFKNEKKAQEFIVAVTKIANEVEATRECDFSVPEGANPLDLQMRMDYTGTSYFYYVVELEEG